MSTTRRLFVGDKIRVANGDRHGPDQLASARTADILLRAYVNQAKPRLVPRDRFVG
jgi:hypothetical protein